MPKARSFEEVLVVNLVKKKKDVRNMLMVLRTQ